MSTWAVTAVPPMWGGRKRSNFRGKEQTVAQVQQPFLPLQTVQQRFKINERFILINAYSLSG